MKASGPLLLARYLALAWLALIVYGSLYPFSGWRDAGVSPFAFFDAHWPRYWTFFDLAANLAVYVPLGFLGTLALARLPGRFSPPLLAALLAGALSFGMESLQTWLPSRVPSNLDFACNLAGGLVGALIAYRLGRRFFYRLAIWQQRLVAPLPRAELGLTLLAAWLFVPLSPEILLFGAGNLRQAFGLSSNLPFAAPSFMFIESTVIACNTLALGLLVRLLLAQKNHAYVVIPLFLLLCLWVRTLAAAVLIGPGEALAWLTPGARTGLTAGGFLLFLALFLPSAPRLSLAALALMAGTTLVNMAPSNPYSEVALATWRQGHFLNFNGFTRFVSALWPFIALPFLLFADSPATPGETQ